VRARAAEPSVEMATQPAPAAPTALFARQPICDARQRIAGYELLYRGERAGDGAVVDDRAATAQVLTGVLGDVGLDQTVGPHPAFVNVDARFLLDVDPLPLPPTRVVLELLERAEPTPELLARLDALRAEGYRIALDDFVFEPHLAPLVERADIVKIDVRALGVAGAVAAARAYAGYDVTLLAEKVENDAEQAACAAAGFELFQGWWFCRPELIEGTQIPSLSLGCLAAAADLASSTAGLAEIEAAVRIDAGLSLRLLRQLNSVAIALPNRVSSVHQAVVLFGEQRLRQWTMLHLLASVGSGHQALLATALVRARMCELLAIRDGAPDPDAWFACGLFSIVDALTGVPMAAVAQELPLATEVRAALVERSGPMGAALDTAIGCEGLGNADTDTLRQSGAAIAWAAQATSTPG
jgi:EAL and modified HD-GYP domain-containing signal transduction protein